MPLDTNAPYANTNSADGSNRTLFVLAGVGSALAALYWGLLTLLLAAAPGPSSAQIVPILLIGLYGFRAYQLFKGDPQAAQRVLWLHAVGGAFALFQLMSNHEGIMVALQGAKVVIHLFGGVTAYLARRSFTAGPAITY